ncbi:hypothetical protein [Tenacibaculum jejuense]|uniref:DoxX family protein n=1 Tax=Tenacibaculum jejuense TaxID=584609 RepID=A0A238U531_9FLAO|nr:hypothetical protein [Tenacibaculum jejuense]SNR14247.1 conserved membrane protein of unknown function [Tenacibaculum jejuense]
MESTSLVITQWSKTKKILFRFFFTYFVLFLLFMHDFSNIFTFFLSKIIPWFGENIFNINYEIKSVFTGSSDTTYNYILIFTVFLFSILSTIIWSLLDRKRTNYKKLYYWLTVSLRFYLALILISYGMAKIIKTQFPYPSYNRLNQTYGESSPMGLAWTFLGFSKGYNLFMGFAEVAAVLLLFRRTLTFGLIITVATLANVVAINFFYDVPVKIVSSHLLLIALFLLAYNVKDLYEFFFLKKPVEIKHIEKPRLKSWMNKTFVVIKIIIIFLAIPYALYSRMGSNEESPLKGYYEVKEFKVNDSVYSASEVTRYEITKWKDMLIESKQWMRIKKGDDKTSWYGIDLNEEKNKLKLTGYRDSTEVYNLKYKEIDTTNFIIRGSLKSDSIHVKFNKTKDYRKNYLLTNRGFHWINERPYNR